MTSCCSSDRWRGATLCLFFASCAQDAVITDVTEPWSVCTGDDGGVTSRCPPSSSSCSEWEDEVSASGSVSLGTDLFPIFLTAVLTGAFLPPLGGMVRILMMILSTRDHNENEGAGRSRKEQEGAGGKQQQEQQKFFSQQLSGAGGLLSLLVSNLELIGSREIRSFYIIREPSVDRAGLYRRHPQLIWDEPWLYEAHPGYYGIQPAPFGDCPGFIWLSLWLIRPNQAQSGELSGTHPGLSGTHRGSVWGYLRVIRGHSGSSGAHPG